MALKCLLIHFKNKIWTFYIWYILSLCLMSLWVSNMISSFEMWFSIKLFVDMFLKLNLSIPYIMLFLIMHNQLLSSFLTLSAKLIQTNVWHQNWITKIKFKLFLGWFKYMNIKISNNNKVWKMSIALYTIPNKLCFNHPKVPLKTKKKHY